MKIDENLLMQMQTKIGGANIHNYLNLETLYGGFINIYNTTSSQEKRDICKYNVKLIEKWFRQFLVIGKLISNKNWSNKLKRW
jgi:hypothetical protein